MQTNNQQKFTISAVIPAYNSRRYIARAIESVLAQTCPPDEIIVVDDGSEDNTAAEVSRFGDKVRLIRQNNAGASAARNTGILAAKGDWIAFLDADDEWLPNKLAAQVDLLKRHPYLIWVTGNFKRSIHDNGQLSDAYTTDKTEDNEITDYFTAYVSQKPGCTDTMIVKKQVLIDAGLFEVGLMRINDEDMWFRIAYQWPQIGYHSEPTAIYHMEVPASITKYYKNSFYICDFLDRHLALAEKYDMKDKFLPCARNMAIHWIHLCWTDERIFNVRKMMCRMKSMLPLKYRTIIYLLTIFPRITLLILPLLRRMNRVFKIPI